MKLTELQQATSDHVFKVLENSKRYLIADEVGLGKTVVTIDLINRLAEKKKTENSTAPFIVYYVCGNERVTTQNCQKMQEECGGCSVKNVRLSMQWEFIDAYKKEASVLILPLTPATTFTHKNSEFNEKEFQSQCSLFKYNSKIRERFNTYFTKLNKENKFDLIFSKADSSAVTQYKEKAGIFPSFTDVRESILYLTFKEWLKPDLIVLDEFQNYSDLMYGNHPLFDVCLEQSSHVLLLSATPYQMSVSEVRDMNARPFDDKLGQGNTSDEEYDESPFAPTEEKSDNENFKALVKFILNRDPSDDELRNTNFLYENVFCRSERSMFYESSKEDEVEYVYSDTGHQKKHIEYTKKLYDQYMCAYEEAGLFSSKFPGEPSDEFIAYTKEAPSPACFATRYSTLKKHENDFDFFHKLQATGKLAVPNEPDSFQHSNLALLKEQACPDGIEKMLWIPSVVFEPEEKDNNPFWQNREYTKSLVFGNYRISTASSSTLLSEYIQSKQKALIKSDDYSTCKLPAEDIDDSFWWPKQLSSPHIEYVAALAELRALVNTYLSKNIPLICAVTQNKCPAEALKTYAAWGGLTQVIEEYAYLLGLSKPTEPPSDKTKKKWAETAKHLQKTTSYFQNEEQTRVIRFPFYDASVNTDDLFDKTDSTFKNECKIPCGFAERFTDDTTDTNTHRKSHQETLQHLFNSPFYPFVLSSTSVAQEGLDFHSYCHRIVHWSVAKTPIAYEQREGRVDRYLSHLIRKRIAVIFPGASFEERLNNAKNCTDAIETVLNQKRPLYPFWYIGPKEYDICHGSGLKQELPKFIRVICAMLNSREGVHFSKLRSALQNYNYHLGPTYQNKQETDRNFCPLLRSDSK